MEAVKPKKKSSKIRKDQQTKKEVGATLTSSKSEGQVRNHESDVIINARSHVGREDVVEADGPNVSSASSVIQTGDAKASPRLSGSPVEVSKILVAETSSSDRSGDVSGCSSIGTKDNSFVHVEHDKFADSPITSPMKPEESPTRSEFVARVYPRLDSEVSEPGEDFSLMPEVDHLYPTLVPIEIGRDSKLRLEDGDVSEIAALPSIDTCEEATAAPTAPAINEETGDFFSMQSLRESLCHIQRINQTQIVEKQDEQILNLVRPSTDSGVGGLYANTLLEAKELEIDKFLRSTSSGAISDFELWELLSNYLRAYNNLIASEKSVISLSQQCEEVEKKVWVMSTRTITQSGTCSDNATVVGTYKVHRAELNKKALADLRKVLKETKELLQDAYPLNTYLVQLCKLQIDHFFYKNFWNYKVDAASSTCFGISYPSKEANEFAQLLRRCISVLFTFIRRPNVKGNFLIDCQAWCDKLVGLLLPIATIEDHFFLFNHVLRTPPSVPSKWAAKFVQIPCVPIPPSSDDIIRSSATEAVSDYCLLALSCLLNPVRLRKELLIGNSRSSFTEASSSPPDSSHSWVVVDSDGEDEGDDNFSFRENDIISLLNQIPFESIFSRGVFIVKHENDYGFAAPALIDYNALKALAFFTKLVDILGASFITFTDSRYNRLTKLIGRLILHATQYITEFINAYANANKVSNATVAREYDIFMHRALTTLLRGATIGTLQFVASAPFSLVSIQMVWEIYASITKWDIYDNDKTWSEDIPAEFEQLLVDLPESDGFYLLTTLANMAIAREGKDNGFVRIVTTHLFQLGFLSPLTRETCSKHARDLLGNITRKFPHLISFLLHSMKSKMDVLRNLSLYLLKELAFFYWRPTESDLQLLSQWIIEYDPSSLENQMARFVMQSMNWHFDEFGKLFLPIGIHRQVALTIVDASSKWEKSGNTVVATVKQASGLGWKNSDYSFVEWSWEIAKRLHLHVFDQPNDENFGRTKFLYGLPTFDDCIDLEPLRKSVQLKQPLGCYVTLLMTPYGHSLPVIESHGWDLFPHLVANFKFEAVMHLMFNLTPLFSNSKHCIAELKTSRFLPIVSSVIGADYTYLNVAKNLISSNFPGATTKRFGEMITAQFNQYYRFGVTEFAIVRLWTEALTSLQGWNKDMNALYLLNILANLCLGNEDCKKYFSDYFLKMLQEIPTESQPGLVSYVLGWTDVPTLLPNTSYPSFPSLAYFVLSLEMDVENSKGFWKSLCQSLSNPKESLESAVKRSCASAKYYTSVNYLSIYRFAQQAIDMPVDSAMTILFLQKFFARLFHRTQANGIGERFFEGMVNSNFQKKLKRKIHELKCFYEKALRTFTDSVTQTDSANHSFAANPALQFQVLKERLTTITAMSLWIEDSQLHRESLYLPALPPQYLPNQLILMLEGYTGDWEDLIDKSSIEEAAISTMKSYLKSINRSCWFEGLRSSRSPDWTRDANRDSQLSKRVTSYDKPQKFHPFSGFSRVLATLDVQRTTDMLAVVSRVKPQLKILSDFSNTFSLRIAQHTGVDCTFLELLPQLYGDHKAEAVVNVKCSGGKNWEPCSGAAPILFKFTESRLNERIGHLIQCNRTEYHQLINEKSLQPPPPTVCVAAVCIEDLISNLVLCKRRDSQSEESTRRILSAGKTLFYDIIKALSEEAYFYPPTRQMFSSFLEVLGSEFITDDPDQYDNLIRICVNNPNSAGAVATHINLVNCTPDNLISIYSLVGTVAKANSDLAFVILSKLDLKKWLQIVQPSQVEVSRLIGVVWILLTSDGPVPSDSFLLIHGCGRNHLQILLMHEFPRFLSETLQLIIAGSGQQLAPIDVWFDVINTLSNKEVQFTFGMDAFLKQQYLQKFGVEKCILPREALFEIIRMLSQDFEKERLTNGLYGLYPKYRLYIEPINLFIHATSYALVSAFAAQNSTMPMHEAIQNAWSSLSSLYAPWILPYNQKMIERHGSSWIQEMNFDNSSAMHPWTVTDAQFGCLFVSSFCESITFFADSVPGASSILSTVLTFYIEHYALGGIKEHVLGIVNNCFVNLMPWSLFWPSIADVEAMNRVVEQYLPGSHSFIGCVLVQVDWTEWVRSICSTNASAVDKSNLSRVHYLVLNMIIRLASDSVARELPSWKDVIERACQMNWDPIQANSIEQIMNWFVMSVDPRVVLPQTVEHPTEGLTFDLLKTACMIPVTEGQCNTSTETTKRKQYLWVRSYVRMLVSVISKHKQYLQSEVKALENSVQTLVDDIVSTNSQVPNRADILDLLQESFSLLANHYLGTISRNALIEWCNNHDDVSLPVLNAFLNCGFDPKVPAYTVIPFAEKVIKLCFKHPEASWDSIVKTISTKFDSSKWNSYYEVACKDGHFMTLYSLLVLHFGTLSSMDPTKSVAFLHEALKILKLKPDNAAVFPLIAGLFLKLNSLLLPNASASLRSQLALFLSNFSKQLNSWAEDGSGWGILDALGLGSQSRLTATTKLYCRCLNAFLTSQLKGSTSIRDSVPASDFAEYEKTMANVVTSLEALKQNRQYSGFEECIQYTITFIQTPKNHFSVDIIEDYNRRLISLLFTETFLH